MSGNILFEHNQKAYKAAVSMMEETGKAAVIHPTGTGKSFIGFQLCTDRRGSAGCLPRNIFTGHSGRNGFLRVGKKL